MNHEKQIGTYPSSNQTDTITYYKYIPKSEIRAVVQISHGMCEYIERYEEFISYLTDRGILVCGNDHLGHGNSISSKENYGYFAREFGAECLPKDLYTLTELIKQEYPDKPYILFGHSMGSFIARWYLEDFGNELDAAVICGTSGGETFSGIGIGFIKTVIKTKGEKYRSDKINKMMFGHYNSHIDSPRTMSDWISRDTEIVDKYRADEKCNFTFTARGCYDLVRLLEKVSRREWAEQVPDELPILLMSGTEDPVGNYGKGVRKVYERLIKAGKNAEIKLYEGARHEPLNETNREEVYKDVADWIDKILTK